MSGAKTGFLVFLGLLAYLVFLVTQFPITHVLARWAPLPWHLEVYGAEGTLFAGRAALVQKESWRFEQVTWEWHPWALVTGSLEFAVTFHNADDNRGKARVGVTFFQQPYLQDMQAQLRLSSLDFLWKPAMINIGGWLKAELSLVWSTVAPSVAGQITLENTVWDGKPPTPLGDFLVTLDDVPAEEDPTDTKRSNDAPPHSSPSQRMVRGHIIDRGGPVQVEGNVQLDMQGAWRLTGTLNPRPDAPAKIRQTLAFLGRPNSDGRFPLSFNGHLPFNK